MPFLKKHLLFRTFLFKLFCLCVGKLCLFPVICGWPMAILSVRSPSFIFLYLGISRIPSGHVLMCISELSNSNETALISGKCSLNKMIWWSPTLKFPVKKFYRNTSCIIILLSSNDKVLVKKTVIITYLLSLEGGGIVPYPGVNLLPFSSVLYQHLSF